MRVFILFVSYALRSGLVSSKDYRVQSENEANRNSADVSSESSESNPLKPEPAPEPLDETHSLPNRNRFDQLPGTRFRMLPPPWGVTDEPKTQNGSKDQEGRQHVNTCPCMKPEGSSSCLAYDPQFQAVNMEEAISSFRDPSDMRPCHAKRLNPNGNRRDKFRAAPGKSILRCSPNDVQCLQCLKKVLSWLEIVADKYEDTTLRSQARAIYAKSGLNFRGGLSDDCPTLSFLKHPNRWQNGRTDPNQQPNFSSKPVDPETIHDIVGKLQKGSERPLKLLVANSSSNDGKQSSVGGGVSGNKGRGRSGSFYNNNNPKWTPSGNSNNNSSNNKNDQQWLPLSVTFHRGEPLWQGSQNSRVSSWNLAGGNILTVDGSSGTELNKESRFRALGDNEDPVKYRVELECKARGSPVEAGSQFCILCGSCWQIVYLRRNYFPQIINQMSCDASSRCLSGYAECKPRYRAMSVLRNDGNDQKPQWTEITLNVPVACECQVRRDSGIFNMALA